jgi:hypothetical protein
MTAYITAIVLSFFGFVLLAALLLVPVYRFLRREETLSRQWTPEALARRMRETASSNGTDPPEHP